MAQDIPQLRIDRLPAVRARTGQSKAAVYAAIKRGTWPRPVRIGSRSVGWPEHEVQAVLAARVRGRTDAEIVELVRALEAPRQNVGVAAA